MDLVHFLSATLLTTALSAPTLHQRDPASQQGRGIASCGTHFYDDGTAENVLFFQGGGHAGEPDHFFAVKFLLEDFNIRAGDTVILGFCAGNSFDLTPLGGPWPNEVFVYPDRDGLPDLERPLRNTTMVTGDGSGDFIGTFPTPVLITSDFWLLNQGFPPHAGEDFNMETDQSSDPLERSYITDRGLPFLFQTEQNLILRAILGIAPSAQPIPALGLAGWLSMVLLLAMVSWWRLRQLSDRAPSLNARHARQNQD